MLFRLRLGRTSLGIMLLNGRVHVGALPCLPQTWLLQFFLSYIGERELSLNSCINLFVFNSSKKGERTGTSFFLWHAFYATPLPCACTDRGVAAAALPSPISLLLSHFYIYSFLVHLSHRLSSANVTKWKGSLRSPSLFTPDLVLHFKDQTSLPRGNTCIS